VNVGAPSETFRRSLTGDRRLRSLGHADIQTTMRYVHYVDSHATRSVKAAQKAELQEWQNRHSELDENWTTGP